VKSYYKLVKAEAFKQVDTCPDYQHNEQLQEVCYVLRQRILSLCHVVKLRSHEDIDFAGCNRLVSADAITQTGSPAPNPNPMNSLIDGVRGGVVRMFVPNNVTLDLEGKSHYGRLLGMVVLFRFL